MTGGRLDIARTALVVHDVVNGFLETGDSVFDAAYANVKALTEAARTAGLQVVFAAPGPGETVDFPRPGKAVAANLAWGSAGVEPPQDLGPFGSDIVIRKPRYGAFFGSGFARWMRETHRDTLVVCGVSLAGGVETTIRDAQNHDMGCIVIADACLCRAVSDQGWGDISREDVARVTLSIVAQRFARVTTTSEFVSTLGPTVA
jgi:nicotinamidase-related amidase